MRNSDDLASSTRSVIDGRLNVVTAGPEDADVLFFVHGNPLDSAGWLYQTTEFSTRYRCISVDLPGYGLSPAAKSGVTMEDIAAACWAACEGESAVTSKFVLVGSSVGATIVQHMYHLFPDKVRGVVISGTGYLPSREFVQGRISEYRTKGLDYRYEYALETFGPDFRASNLGQWFANLFANRSDHADVESIIHTFEAFGIPDPEWLQKDLSVPVLFISGDEDPVHHAAFELVKRFPDAQLVALGGAGHACQLDQPWEYNKLLQEFLSRCHA